MGQLLRLRFGKEAARDGHSRNFFQTVERHVSRVCHGFEWNATAAVRGGRKMGEDVEIGEPTETGKVLVLRRGDCLQTSFRPVLILQNLKVKKFSGACT